MISDSVYGTWEEHIIAAENRRFIISKVLVFGVCHSL